jgi:hypothetical protein
MKKIAIIFIALFFTIRVFSNDTLIVRRGSKREIDILNDKSLKLNDKSLYREIKNKGILYPDIAFSQALLESNHYKSHLARHNKNLFGMVVSQSRRNVAIGRSGGYAVYVNWTNSVLDYKIWQDHIPDKAKRSKQSYYEFIQKRYSHTKTYCKLVRSIVKSYRRFFDSIEMDDTKDFKNYQDTACLNSFLPFNIKYKYISHLFMSSYHRGEI